MNALYKVQIKTNKPLSQNRENNKKIINEIRKLSILDARKSNIFAAAKMKLICDDSLTEKYPTILYELMPGRDVFNIYGRGYVGRYIIEKLSNYFIEKEKLHINHGTISILEKKMISVEPFLVTKQEKYRNYCTRMPVVFCNTDQEFEEWFSIYKKRTKSNTQYVKKMKKYLKNRIVSSIKRQIEHVVFEGIDAHVAMDEIKNLSIDIKNFDFEVIDHPKNGKPTPLLHMQFKSKYTMPRFIGYCNELGYGVLETIDLLKPRKKNISK